MRYLRFAQALLLALVGACAVAPAAFAQATVSTQHNDVFRTGLQLDTQLTTANVAAKFGRLFARSLPDGPNAWPGLRQRTYAQPLVATLPNGKSIVIVATDFNMVYAFDAQDPAAGAPIWTADLGPQEIAKNGDWADDNCNKTLPAIGVLGTPVIERHMLPGPTKKFSPDALFVVSKNRKNAADITSHDVSFTIHKIDVATGKKLAALPITGGPAFDPYQQVQRAGLVFVERQNVPGGGYVYAGFSAHCDSGGAHGWLMGFDGNLTKQAPPFDAAPDGAGAGIWQAGQAPVWFRSHPDGTDYLIVNTGNALAGSKPKLSQSVLKLKVGASGDLTLADSFTPYNRAFLDSCDGDFSAAGPMMLRDKKHIVTGGKQGILYVLDVDNLGHGTAADPGGQPGDCTNAGYGIFGLSYNSMHWNSLGDAVFQEFVGGKGHVHGSPVSAIDKTGKLRIYVWTERDNLKAYTRFANGKFNTQPVVNISVATTPVHPGADHPAMPGGMLSLSGSPGQAGNVIVWATYPASDAFNPDYSPGVKGMLYAFDGADVTKLLWSSEMVPGDALGEYAKFTPPTIANGHVYVATFDGKLQVYGLLTKSNKNACGGYTKLPHLPGSACQVASRCGSWQCAGTNALTCNTSKASQNVCGGCLPIVVHASGHSRGDPCICDNAARESGFLVCSGDKGRLICCPCSSAPGCGPGSPPGH